MLSVPEAEAEVGLRQRVLWCEREVRAAAAEHTRRGPLPHPIWVLPKATLSVREEPREQEVHPAAARGQLAESEEQRHLVARSDLQPAAAAAAHSGPIQPQLAVVVVVVVRERDQRANQVPRGRLLLAREVSRARAHCQQ